MPSLDPRCTTTQFVLLDATRYSGTGKKDQKDKKAKRQKRQKDKNRKNGNQIIKLYIIIIVPAHLNVPFEMQHLSPSKVCNNDELDNYAWC